MKSKLISLAAIAAMMASCSSEEAIEVNPDPQGNALSFSIAVGNSRATETNITNLGDFNVVAKGIHPHGDVYSSFLIGSSDAGELVSRKGDITDGKGIWELERKVYWPSSIDDALFWAWTCSQVNGTGKSPVLPTGTFSFSEDNKTLQVKDFTLAKADLEPAEVPAGGIYADGANQVDFLTAFKQEKRTSTVGLKFNHVLSQIGIFAKSKDKDIQDHRIVRIKGAWIVNTKDKGTLKSGFSWVMDTKTATHSLGWESESLSFKSGDMSAYGSYYNTPLVLENKNTEQNLLQTNGTLMLIPQEIKEWDKKAITGDNKEQAYILLLCRVELKHSGTQHNGDTDDDIAVNGENHYHQLFPVNTTNTFNEAEYGFVCVPIGTTFEMGKKYKITLDMCGAVSGAGNYPPENTNFFNSLLPKNKNFTTNWGTNTVLSIISRASGKNVGEPVLDEPIKFSVEVSGWDENNWTNGNEIPLD